MTQPTPGLHRNFEEEVDIQDKASVTASLARPIIGIEDRAAQEVFDIMCDRFRHTAALSVEKAPAVEENEPPVQHVQLVTDDIAASRGVTVNVVGKVHFERVVGDRHCVLKGGCHLDGGDVFALFIAYLDRLEHQLLPGRDMLGHNVTNGVHGLIASCIEIFQFGTLEIANEVIPLSQVKEVFRHKVGSRLTLVEPRVPPRVPRRMRTLPSRKPVGTSVEAMAFGREIIQDLSELDGGPFGEEHHRNSVEDHCHSSSAVDHGPGAVAVSDCPESSSCGNAHEEANKALTAKVSSSIAPIEEVGADDDARRAARRTA